MKKLLLILISVPFLFGCAAEHKKKNDLSELNLKGHVKSVKVSSYQAVNKLGYITKGSVRFDNSFDDEPSRKFTNNGNLIEVDSYELDGTILWKTIYKLDEKGRKIESNDYKSNGTLDWKTIYNLDDKGNLIHSIYYNSDGTLSGKTIYKVDNKGYLIESNYYNSDGTLRGKEIYKRDKRGNIIEKVSPRSIMCRAIYKLDDKGNKLESDIYNSDGTLERKKTFKYTFDKENNWVKRIDYKNNIPTFILEREIEYY